MSEFENLVGKWVSALPWDSDDFLVEYVVSVKDGCPHVEATDLQDQESMEISEVTFSNGVLSFVSLMSSTGRRGVNRFVLLSEDRIRSEFTFTVEEELRKVD